MQFIIHKDCFELFLSAHFSFLRNSLLESDVCRIHVKLKLSSAWKITRKRKSRNSLIFYIYAQPFIHCHYFIYARKIYVRVHVKITRHWKPTLTERDVLYSLCQEEPEESEKGDKKGTNKSDNKAKQKAKKKEKEKDAKKKSKNDESDKEEDEEEMEEDEEEEDDYEESGDGGEGFGGEEYILLLRSVKNDRSKHMMGDKSVSTLPFNLF